MLHEILDNLSFSSLSFHWHDQDYPVILFLCSISNFQILLFLSY